MAGPHLLILDEPTNHLDIDSRRALLDALNDYEGAVILITHDRSLIELVSDRLWLAADGHIKPFAGDMDDYARFVLDRARAGVSAPSQNVDPRVVQQLSAPGTGHSATAENALSAEQKAARDAQNAARKAAKKKRRRG